MNIKVSQSDSDVAQEKRAESDAIRFKQLQIAFEKMGASVGMWYQRFTRKKPEAPFAWVNSGPALFAAFEGTNNGLFSSSSLKGLKETARLFLLPEPKLTPEADITIDGLPVHSTPVSLDVFNELENDRKNLEAHFLNAQKRQVPDLLTDPDILFQEQLERMHNVAAGYNMRIMPDSSVAHCSNKVAMLSEKFGACTLFSRLTGQPHKIISVFDSKAKPKTEVTRFDLEPNPSLVPAFKPAYA